MAGGYQTAGETARRGTNVGADMGGGWINGRGDDTMTMFIGYGHMVDFFTGFEWWKTNPHDELVNNGNYCLADPGKTYAIYLPHGGRSPCSSSPAAIAPLGSALRPGKRSSCRPSTVLCGPRRPRPTPTIGPSFSSERADINQMAEWPAQGRPLTGLRFTFSVQSPSESASLTSDPLTYRIMSPC